MNLRIRDWLNESAFHDYVRAETRRECGALAPRVPSESPQATLGSVNEYLTRI
jgi:hypothetical protein